MTNIQIMIKCKIYANWYIATWKSKIPLFRWTASSEFGTYRLCQQRRFRRACASAQSPQNLRCSLIQAVSQEEPSERKPDPWPLWMAGHAQLKFVMTEPSKTQIRLTGLRLCVCRLKGHKNTSFTNCLTQIELRDNYKMSWSTTKWTVHPANTDQPGCPPSQIRVFVVYFMGN